MATLTPPTNELNTIVRGDLDVLNAYAADNGTGTIYVRSGGLYVEGLTDLDQTTITTTDGDFTVTGSNKISFNISGGATSSIEMTAEDASFFTTTAGALTLSATATDANGKITIQAAGTGTDSILIDANNTTSGQVTIQSASADTSSDAIRLLATDTTGGNILLQGSGDFTGSVPAIKLYTDNATSGQILLESAGDSSTSDAIKFLASGTTDGNILLEAAGTNTNDPAVKLLASNTTSGQVLLQGSGNIADSIRITADNVTAGGIDIDATGLIAIDTTSTSSGVTIATATAGVPVVIGTSTSTTTIAGDLLVQGTTTTINTETLVIEDNIILLNSGNGELGLDSGVVIRRFQTPNDAGTGDVVTSPNPIQESGAFQAGSSTPATLVLDQFASSTDDFYNGWWIKITSGAGINQVRRIKDYVGSTKTVTLYVTADNTATFTDGLDLTTAPAAADTYELYSDSYSMSFYDESNDHWTFANVADTPDAISAVGTSTAIIQQYQQVHSGEIDIHPQIYDNVFGSASGTTITFTLRGHGLAVQDKVGISNSANFSPAITTGAYVVQTVPDANTFTITADASTTSGATSSATITAYETSLLKVNRIRVHDTAYGAINIEGLSCVQDIVIAKTSTAYFFIDECTTTYGALLIMIADLNNTDGSFGVFIAARSTAANQGTITRLATAKGTDGQRIDADWLNGEQVKIKQSPAGVGAGNYTYRVRIYSVL